MRAYAINPPNWDEFAKGEFIDTANVKANSDIVSGYVRDAKAGKQRTTLYEVDCKGDKIRVHSDVPRYVSVPVKGGGRVIDSDDGFRTVEPGSRNARIENAICGIAIRQEAETAKQEQHAECESAKKNDELRVILLKDQLTHDQTMCLLGMTSDVRYPECDRAGVPRDTSVVQYLHGKGIFLKCEDRPKHSAATNGP